MSSADDAAAAAAMLSPADRLRAAELLADINLALLGERRSVALCALTGVLALVVADMQVKQDVPVGSTVRMLAPLLEMQAARLAETKDDHHHSYHAPGHA
ncbi:MAG TPA: hypothetical protein VHT74_00715 [Acetobacteraceae bacterium]|jgi:hypothetical protein|nr:hypothetical protein [Acetobacteraceae bacterium]